MEEVKAIIIEKVMELVNKDFGGDWERAYDFYAARGGATGLVELDETKGILRDAGISGFTNGIPFALLAPKVHETLDINGDETISKEEFRSVLDTASQQ